MIAQKPERSTTGAERDHFLTCQLEEDLVVNLTGVDSAPTLVVESVERELLKGMARSATLVTGSVRVLSHQSQAQTVVLPVKVVAQEQTTVRELKVSGIADLLPLHGVRVIHKDRKMVQDHPDASSRSAQLLRELPLRLSRTTSGAPRCDQMPQQPSRQFHPAMAVRLLLHQLLLTPFLSVDPS